MKKRVWLNLRLSLTERVEAFRSGFKRLGYEVYPGLKVDPEPGDVFVTWNRIGAGDEIARRFEERGLPVLVAENASWGNEFAGGRWLTLARNRHNTAGTFPVGDAQRWDALGVELEPWRPEGGEVVGLPQRGIGSEPTAMPRYWMPPGCDRIRDHPGQSDKLDLRKDLKRASKVVTWGSGAAVKALMWGIRVESHMPQWIAEQDNTDAGRLAMFRRLAWAQFQLSEVGSGYAFERLLCES